MSNSVKTKKRKKKKNNNKKVRGTFSCFKRSSTKHLLIFRRKSLLLYFLLCLKAFSSPPLAFLRWREYNNIWKRRASLSLSTRVFLKKTNGSKVHLLCGFPVFVISPVRSSSAVNSFLLLFFVFFKDRTWPLILWCLLYSLFLLLLCYCCCSLFTQLMT